MADRITKGRGQKSTKKSNSKSKIKGKNSDTKDSYNDRLLGTSKSGSKITKGKGRSSKQKSFSSNGSRKSQSTNEKDSYSVLKISGVDQVIQKNLKGFLIKKTLGKVTIIKFLTGEDGAIVTVLNKSHATKVLELDGTLYFGKNLSITLIENNTAEGSSSSKGKLQELMEKFLLTRISTDSKVLNLQFMNNDPILKEIDAQFIIGSLESKVINAIFAIAARKYPEIETMDLSNNAMTSLSPISSISLHFPKLKNLSLQSNPVANIKELDYLGVAGSTKSLKYLRELQMTDTNIRNSILSNPGGDVMYLREIVTRFPSLEVLDSFVVAADIKANIIAEFERDNPGKIKSLVDTNNSSRSASTLTSWSSLVPISGSFTDSENTKNLVSGFIQGFFQLYDQNRGALGILYSEDSQFSISLNTSQPPSFIQNGLKNPLSMSKHLEHSHNLTKVKDYKRRKNNLFIGPQSIVSKIISLPGTVHILNDTNSFTYDSWGFPLLISGVFVNVIMIIVHGEFQEPDTNSKYSFDRTFMLSEAPQNSQALNSGWPCIIRQDLLSIRFYSGTDSFQIENTNPISQPINDVSNVVPTMGHTPEQMDLINKISAVTGLNQDWSTKCLLETGWDPQKALEAFNILKGSIPPEAFIR
ncbi:hypothetical protein BB559_000002 [Furculomyces boomerangus]|uniref:mRNA export factor MEX67 n=2 Tax=Harpellales TaxID=61421 RepID=A0A2T9Z6L0_9FUNG|nr:hypothetical protein BB559_000002 [Furculomyces boomerangus]PVZ99375.1 hypothetical protein BB558_004614 [Smittium angustum]